MVGTRYCPPSLETLARFWFDSNCVYLTDYILNSELTGASAEIRLSARALFDATVGQLNDEEVLSMATDYQHRRTYAVICLAYT